MSQLKECQWYNDRAVPLARKDNIVKVAVQQEWHVDEAWREKLIVISRSNTECIETNFLLIKSSKSASSFLLFTPYTPGEGKAWLNRKCQIIKPGSESWIIKSQRKRKFENYGTFWKQLGFRPLFSEITIVCPSIHPSIHLANFLVKVSYLQTYRSFYSHDILYILSTFIPSCQVTPRHWRQQLFKKETGWEADRRSGKKSGTIFSDPNPLFNYQDNLLASINPELANNQWGPR